MNTYLDTKPIYVVLVRKYLTVLLGLFLSFILLPVYLWCCWHMAFCLSYMRSYMYVCVRTFCSLSELVPNICVLVKCIFVIKILTKKDDFCAQLNCRLYFCVEKFQFSSEKNLQTILWIHINSLLTFHTETFMMVKHTCEWDLINRSLFSQMKNSSLFCHSDRWFTYFIQLIDSLGKDFRKCVFMTINKLLFTRTTFKIIIGSIGMRTNFFFLYLVWTKEA